MNRPGRKAGIGIAEKWNAEGAAPEMSRVPRLRRSIFHPELDPGLTAGPTNFRPFGPRTPSSQGAAKICRMPETIFRIWYYF